MSGCGCGCGSKLCLQVSGLPQGGAPTPNEQVLVYDSTVGCPNGMRLRQLPNENEVLGGFGPPTAPPPDPTEGKNWFNRSTNQYSHYWDPATATWIVAIGTFPIIQKCDNTPAVPTDRFFTYGSVTAAVDGVLGTAVHLLGFPDAGTCPVKVRFAGTCTTLAPAAFGGLVLGAINAAGDLGLVRAPNAQPRVVTVAGSATVDLLTTDTHIITGAGVVTLPTPTAGNFCQSRRVTVKRTSNNPLDVVRVVAAAGIDGAPGNNIQLGTSSKFGTLTGEAATFELDGATWRIVGAY